MQQQICTPANEMHQMSTTFQRTYLATVPYPRQAQNSRVFIGDPDKGRRRRQGHASPRLDVIHPRRAHPLPRARHDRFSSRVCHSRLPTRVASMRAAQPSIAIASISAAAAAAASASASASAAAAILDEPAAPTQTAP